MLRVPVTEFRDAFLPLDDVVPGRMEELADRLATGSEEGWAEIAFAFLRERISVPNDLPGLSARAVEDIRTRGGRVTVRALARRLHVSERHLQRTMREEVGLAPIVLAQIIRIQGALRGLLDRPGDPLSRIALESGFYDQPHFVREFRRFVGCTPSQFRDADHQLTGHFVGP